VQSAILELRPEQFLQAALRLASYGIPKQQPPQKAPRLKSSNDFVDSMDYSFREKAQN
jgi:hypothetical protein